MSKAILLTERKPILRIFFTISLFHKLRAYSICRILSQNLQFRKSILTLTLINISNYVLKSERNQWFSLWRKSVVLRNDLALLLIVTGDQTKQVDRWKVCYRSNAKENLYLLNSPVLCLSSYCTFSSEFMMANRQMGMKKWLDLYVACRTTGGVMSAEEDSLVTSAHDMSRSSYRGKQISRPEA